MVWIFLAVVLFLAVAFAETKWQKAGLWGLFGLILIITLARL